jgi:hypothetical protein
MLCPYSITSKLLALSMNSIINQGVSIIELSKIPSAHLYQDVDLKAIEVNVHTLSPYTTTIT